MLQTSTLNYIKKLQKNNNKLWFEENRHLFNEAKDDFEKLVTDIITSFGKVDTDIAPLQAKDCIFFHPCQSLHPCEVCKEFYLC